MFEAILLQVSGVEGIAARFLCNFNARAFAAGVSRANRCAVLSDDEDTTAAEEAW